MKPPTKRNAPSWCNTNFLTYIPRQKNRIKYMTNETKHMYGAPTRQRNKTAHKCFHSSVG
jgi:hypothetical protein